MIAQLRGILVEKDATSVVIDVNGVGYAVTCAARTLDQLAPIGTEVTLAVETQFRAEHLELFGFMNATERQWFRLLQTVQGVGARVALAILSVLPPPALYTALVRQDAQALTSADGVGPKLAARLVMELKDKALSPIFALSSTTPTGSTEAPTSGAHHDTSIPEGFAFRDATEALIQLGYRRADVQDALQTALRQDATLSVEALVKQGLQKLARNVG